MTILTFPTLPRVLREQQLVDGFARRHPTLEEQIVRHKSAHEHLTQQASQVRRSPLLRNPDDFPPCAA